MDLKKRRAELERELQQAQVQISAWMEKAHRAAGAIAENEAMQKAESAPKEEATSGSGTA